jgi:formylglycine-generating enzyme required for sulfatase activity
VFFEKIMMEKKAQCLTLLPMVVNAAALLSAPKEKSGSTSADRADVITNSIGMKLVRIPAGEFMMGAEEDRDATMGCVSHRRSCAAAA